MESAAWINWISIDYISRKRGFVPLFFSLPCTIPHTHTHKHNAHANRWQFYLSVHKPISKMSAWDAYTFRPPSPPSKHRVWQTRSPYVIWRLFLIASRTTDRSVTNDLYIFYHYNWLEYDKEICHFVLINKSHFSVRICISRFGFHFASAESWHSQTD